MKILFIHQNFPGQFKFLAPALAKRGHEVKALSPKSNDFGQDTGIEHTKYRISRFSTKDIHPWVADFEPKIIRAEACFNAAKKLKEDGFTPDKIIAHYGWGESLFLKLIWPEAKLGLYCEFFYRSSGADVGFDPEFAKTDLGDNCRLQLKNLNNYLHFPLADGALCPTHWQASTFPTEFKGKITIVHDGIDTDVVSPSDTASIKFKSGMEINSDSEIITFVARTLEPYRGYHIFMRSLPKLLAARPNARVMIVGSDGGGYGAPPDKGKYKDMTWKNIFIDELKKQLSPSEWSRIHFLGHLEYPIFLKLLQVSTVHVYLTYPFILSWSLLEAMSTGCAIIASDTQPLHEAITHEETGLLVNFFDHQSLADTIVRVITDKDLRSRLAKNARNFAIENYDLYSACLPIQLKWVEEL